MRLMRTGWLSIIEGMVDNYFKWSIDTTLSQQEDVVVYGGTQKCERAFNMDRLLQDYESHLVVTYRKQHTFKTYLNGAKQYLTFSHGVFDRETVNNYVKYLYKTFKPNTIAGYIESLDKLLKYLDLEQYHVPIPKGTNIIRDTITLEQIQDIKNYARNNINDDVIKMQEYLVVQFITDLDTRNHEITKSRWKYIRENKILFEDCKTGNTYGFLSDETLLALDRYKPMMKYRDRDYVFVNQRGSYRGSKWSDNGWKIHDIIGRISRHVIGRRLCPQDFRASVITEEYNHWVNPLVIQRKARHRSQKTTLKYNHVDERHLKDYIDSGTIFGVDKGVISKPNQSKGLGRGSHIKTLSQDFSEDENNSSFSFSVSPFFGLLGVGC